MSDSTIPINPEDIDHRTLLNRFWRGSRLDERFRGKGDEYMGATELAGHLGLSTGWVSNLATAGRLPFPSFWVGEEHLVRRADVTEWEAEQAVAA